MYEMGDSPNLVRPENIEFASRSCSWHSKAQR